MERDNKKAMRTEWLKVGAWTAPVAVEGTFHLCFFGRVQLA